MDGVKSLWRRLGDTTSDRVTATIAGAALVLSLVNFSMERIESVRGAQIELMPPTSVLIFADGCNEFVQSIAVVAPIVYVNRATSNQHAVVLGETLVVHSPGNEMSPRLVRASQGTASIARERIDRTQRDNICPDKNGTFRFPGLTITVDYDTILTYPIGPDDVVSRWSYFEYSELDCARERDVAACRVRNRPTFADYFSRQETGDRLVFEFSPNLINDSSRSSRCVIELSEQVLAQIRSYSFVHTSCLREEPARAPRSIRS